MIGPCCALHDPQPGPPDVLIPAFSMPVPPIPMLFGSLWVHRRIGVHFAGSQLYSWKFQELLVDEVDETH